MQIFPFGETLEIVSMFTNNHDGTNVNGGNLDWAWTFSNSQYFRAIK